MSSGNAKLKSGWLTKEGGKFKTWHKRWFVLFENQTIFYSKEANSGELGMIKLAGVNPNTGVVPSEKKKNKKNCFEVRTPARTFYLIARDEGEMNSWMKAIINCIQQTGTSSNSKKEVGLKDFDLLTVIGKGSFGKVLQVMKKDTKKIYAMKVLNKKNILENNELEHTRAEKNILQKLIHPFLVNLNYAFQTPDKIYFVMDYVNGGELFYHLQKEHKFTPERVRFYCAEIVLGLEYLHNSGVIYRDLKPENILLTEDGHICMTDFGISKEGLLAEDSRTETFCGTPEYLAPEVLEGKGYTKAVDWWSFGTLMFEMLNGLPPFYSQDVQQMYFKIMHAKLEFPETLGDEKTKSILLGLLERDVSKRLADANKVKAHPYFKGMDWEALLRQEVTPPFIPPVKDKTDISMVDPTFTSERVTLSEEVEETSKIKELTEDHQKKFSDFAYNIDQVQKDK